MPRARKLNARRAAIVREVQARRAELMAAVRALPTLEQLAERWAISVSVLKQVSAGNTYRDASRESD